MTDDIVSRLRLYAERQKQTRSTVLGLLLSDSADEIERLRKELGQVSDADSWVSEADAAHLDSLLNWCEFNAMDWHRALARLVNDRARLRGEVNRLRAGGCARDQRTTQFCAEALTLQREVERLRDALRIEQEELAACCIDRRETQRERDEARKLFCEDRFHNGKHHRSVNGDLVVCASPREIAADLGWDCFKENTDE